jgi:hypothetical protein
MKQTLSLALILFTACTEAADIEQPLDDESAIDQDAVEPFINNLEWRYTYSSNSKDWWRSPETNCSTNRVLYGMGVALPLRSEILFRGMTPYGYGAPWSASEAAAQTRSKRDIGLWQMTNYAVCGAPMPGLEVVTRSMDSDISDPQQQVDVACPSGKKVIGAGGTITWGEGLAKIDEIRPNESLTQVTVTASEASRTDQVWTVTAYAVCATPPAGLVRATGTLANGWTSTNEVIASCPDEKRLLSVAGGVDIISGARRDTRVYQIVPSFNLKYAIVRAGGPSSGLSGNVKAYAICADG